MIIDIQRQPGANVIEVVRQIREEIPKVQRAIPAGVKLTIVSDRTVTIRASVRDVQFTLILSVVLVTLVVLLFLRSLRATLIAGVALPLSLITSFGIMYFAGFSLDNLSLMALTIGTGFVVDDAIVMIENIVRHMENGEIRDGGVAEGRQRNRLHRDFADGVADRGVHPAAVHVRAGRAHVPRIRADADDRGRDLGDRVADADADDVFAAVEACRRGDDGPGACRRQPLHRPHGRRSTIARCCGCCSASARRWW